MKTYKTRKRSQRVPATARRRTVSTIALVLSLIAAGGALAQWAGVVSLTQKQSKKKGPEIGIQSFSPRQITTAASAAQSYSMSYKYDLAGNLTSQTYPSNKEYRTNYDNAGLVASVSRYNTGVFDKTYASQFSYASHGAVAAMTLGNNLVDKTEFNGRLQPTFIKLGTIGNPTSVLQLGYTYNTVGQANNNGNVLTQTITAPKTKSGTGNLHGTRV